MAFRTLRAGKDRHPTSTRARLAASDRRRRRLGSGWSCTTRQDHRVRFLGPAKGLATSSQAAESVIELPALAGVSSKDDLELRVHLSGTVNGEPHSANRKSCGEHRLDRSAGRRVAVVRRKSRRWDVPIRADSLAGRRRSHDAITVHWGSICWPSVGRASGRGPRRSRIPGLGPTAHSRTVCDRQPVSAKPINAIVPGDALARQAGRCMRYHMPTADTKFLAERKLR